MIKDSSKGAVGPDTSEIKIRPRKIGAAQRGLVIRGFDEHQNLRQNAADAHLTLSEAALILKIKQKAYIRKRNKKR